MRCCFALVGWLLLAGLVLGQTGDITPTEIELSTLKPFVPSKIELIEQPAVDLRPWMPPVGQQRMNDCTAWAVAYAAKSYAEARDQKWKPDRASRQFNPQYVYNQINGGSDSGSNFVKAIRFMAKSGASTFATGKYRAGDFRRQPNAKEKQEAAAFPVHDGVLVKNRLGIRRALQRREVVIFGANVGPAFLGGTFKSYTKEIFRQDSVMRKPGQPHGKHAMVIVGYDDHRNCFLIQNSWGTKWGWRGFAWVSYELFDEIKIDKSGSVFCSWACLLVDVEEPVAYGPDGVPRSKPLDLKTLKIKGHSDVIRYNSKRNKYVYVFTSELRGQKVALEKIEKVTWKWTNEQGELTNITTSRADARFTLQAGTNQNPLQMTCEISFKDGKTKTIKGEIVGPNPKADFRNAGMYFKDDYFSSRRGFPVWEVEVYLDYPLEQRLDIVKVEWDLGPGCIKARHQTMTGFNGPVAEETPTGFFRGPSLVTAKIHYNDGGIKSVSKRVSLTDKIEKNYHLDITSRPIGLTDGGDTLRAIRLTIDYPKLDRMKIDEVHYTVDPHINPNTLVGYKPWGDFEAFVKSERDFRVTAKILFSNKTQQVLTQWVKLAPDSAYKNPIRLGLRSTDRYQGSFVGQPKFIGNFQLMGDREVVERIKTVHFFFDPDNPKDKGVRIFDNRHRYVFERGLTSDNQKIKAVIDFGDGQTVTLNKVHKRHSDRHDGFGLQLKTQKRPPLETLNEPELTLRLEAEVSGPSLMLDRIHSVDWVHTVGSRTIRTANRTNRFKLATTRKLKTSFNRPFLLSAYVQDIEGYGQLIEAPITATSGGDQREDAQLRVKEKFWSYKDGVPNWMVEVAVIVNERVYPSEVTSLKLHRTTREGRTWKTFEATNYTVAYLTKEPHEIIGDVTFADGKTLRLYGKAPLLCKRPAQPITIVPIKSGADTFAYECVIVDGWEEKRRQIRKVEFDFKGEKHDQTIEYDNTTSILICAMYFPTGEEEVQVKVTLADGTTHVAKSKIGKPAGSITTRSEVRYWGKGSWELTIIPQGDWIDIGERDVWRDAISTGYLGESAHAWPPGIERIRTKTPKAIKTSPHTTRANQKSVTVHHQVGPKPGQTTGWMSKPPETFRLIVQGAPLSIALHSKGEWTAYIWGPEGIMVEIEHVEYFHKIGDRDAHYKEHRRFGELQEGFETRIFAPGTKMPEVRAIITLKDGRRNEVKGQWKRF